MNTATSPPREDHHVYARRSPASARTELLIILAVVILLFGASKLPELARGSGRALRIFKAETKGLRTTTTTTTARPPEQRELEARQAARRATLEAEQPRARATRRDDTTA